MEFFKNHWKALLGGAIAIFNGIIITISLLGYTIGYYVLVIANLCLGIIYPIVEMVEKIQSKNEVVTAQIPVETENKLDFIKEKVKNIDLEISKGKTKLSEKKEKNRILVDLINNNIISVQTLDENIKDKRFISVLCYQAGFNLRSKLISEEIDKKIKEDIERKKQNEEPVYNIDINREYPEIFNKLNFIKLTGNSPFYIIPEENIYPEKLRTLDKISDYLIKKGSIAVSEEWLKLKNIYFKHDKNFYEKMKDEKNPVNFNILIMRINRRDMRHRYILRNDFRKEFSSELSAIVKLNKFKTTFSEKMAIKNIINKSSLKILILSLTEKEQEKILELEEEFKKPLNEGGLGIVNFYDYHKKKFEDIKKILKNKFRSEKKLTEYSKMIYDNSKDFRNDLIELGIDI